MTSQVEAIGRVPTRWRRVLNFPLVRISVAILFIAIPVAAVEIPLNLFVTDKSLRGLGALLLAAVVLVAYRTYVRVMEKRPVTELSGRRAGLEAATGDRHALPAGHRARAGDLDLDFGGSRPGRLWPAKK